MHLTLANVVKGECYVQGGFFGTHPQCTLVHKAEETNLSSTISSLGQRCTSTPLEDCDGDHLPSIVLGTLSCIIFARKVGGFFISKVLKIWQCSSTIDLTSPLLVRLYQKRGDATFSYIIF